jgi:hypothetical protein
MNGSTCTTCPSGHYCPAGVTSPALCLEGTFSASGAASCTKCNTSPQSDGVINSWTMNYTCIWNGSSCTASLGLCFILTVDGGTWTACEVFPDTFAGYAKICAAGGK